MSKISTVAPSARFVSSNSQEAFWQVMEVFISALCSMGYSSTALNIVRKTKKEKLKDRHGFIFNVTELLLFRIDGPLMEKEFLYQLPIWQSRELEEVCIDFDAPVEADKKRDLLALLEDVRAVIPYEGGEVTQEKDLWIDLFSTYAGIKKKYGGGRWEAVQEVEMSLSNIRFMLNTVIPVFNTKGGTA